LRYRHFPERGSGIGSRGDNLLRKRQLLREQGVEAASSHLLEVIKGPAADAPAAETVICFEVLIHQGTDEAYRVLIDFLAEKTIGSLLVSGFAADHDSIRNNLMLFFHEPLQTSLRRTGRFRTIRQIGAHTNVRSNDATFDTAISRGSSTAIRRSCWPRFLKLDFAL